MQTKALRAFPAFALPALALLTAACSPAPKTQQPTWDQYLNGYLEGYFQNHPVDAVNAGRHEFDGRLPDLSKEGLARELARLHTERDRVSAFDTSAYSDAQKFEREYLLASLDSDLFWLETAEWPYRNPFFYNGMVDPNVYLTRPYAPLPQRMKAFIDYEKNLPNTLNQIKANLRTPMARTFVDQGKLIFGGLADYFEKDVPAIFSTVTDETLQDNFKKSNATAIQSLKAFNDYFESLRPSATDDFALGAEKFQKMLHATERVDVPLDKLQAIGQADLDRNMASLKDACAKFAPGKSLTDCVAKESADKPRDKPVEAARTQLKELRAFVLDKNLMSIPGTEEALVDEAPPYARWNFAYINIPGPYEKNLPSVYYISPPDPKWTPAVQKAYLPSKNTLLFTSAHEVMPGHFLQFLHANRAPSKFGQIFVGYAFAEGWAHYCEEMTYEAGLGNQDPEVHIGQLREALLRNVRFMSAIGMATGKMTVAQSEKMFIEQGFSDAGNSKQQANRGTFDPAYLNYTMGKLMIRKLREDWTASHGGRGAWKDFHDKFLDYGGPPIPLVRAAMLGAQSGPPL